MDKWKATSRLTLNVGLRYDFQGTLCGAILRIPSAPLAKLTSITEPTSSTCGCQLREYRQYRPMYSRNQPPANVVISP